MFKKIKFLLSRFWVFLGLEYYDICPFSTNAHLKGKPESFSFWTNSTVVDLQAFCGCLFRSQSLQETEQKPWEFWKPFLLMSSCHEERQLFSWFEISLLCRVMTEPSVSSQTIYDHEVKLPHRIPELLWKADLLLSLHALILIQALLRDLDLGNIDWHLTKSIRGKNSSCATKKWHL